jgi:hypothetical protein
MFSAKANRDAETSLRTAVEEFSEYFVEHVWLGILKGKPPTSAKMRAMSNAFRWSFISSYPAKAPEVKS